VSAPSSYHLKPPIGFDHKYTSKPSYVDCGITLAYDFPKRFGLSASFLFSKLNYHVDYAFTFMQGGDPQIPRSGDITASYLVIPFFFDFNINTGSKGKIVLGAGIISSMLINANDKTTFEDNSVRNSGNENSFLFGLATGVNYQYSLNDKLSLELGGQYGFYTKGVDTIMNQNPSVIRGMLGVVYNF
jgi:long-subunit fatty acid transport protein